MKTKLYLSALGATSSLLFVNLAAAQGSPDDPWPTTPTMPSRGDPTPSVQTPPDLRRGPQPAPREVTTTAADLDGPYLRRVDEPIVTRRRGPPPAAERAVELTVAPGYTQGFGGIGRDLPNVQDVGNAGGGLQLGVGYRLNPAWAVGIYGSGAAFGRGDRVDSSAGVWSTTLGAQVDWHAMPSRTWDPWVSLGTGWRAHWVSSSLPGADQTLHGWQIAKLQVGVDYRPSESASVGPVVGADLSMFFNRTGDFTSSNIVAPRLNTFVFAGIMGRFDIPTGGTSSRSVARR